MKRALQVFVICLALGVVAAYAHHPAADVVDEDIYEIITEMVSETPHAEMTFDDDMGGGLTETTLITTNVRSLENLVDDGLLEYASMLDGDVSISIDFQENGSVLTVLSQEE